MGPTQQVLSDIVVYNKYAKYLPELKRRENWFEIVDRYIIMMLGKYATKGDVVKYTGFRKTTNVSPKEIINVHSPLFTEFAVEIITNGLALYDRDVLMSMRMAQFAGAAIEKNEARGYNCAFLPIDHHYAFSEIMFLLLGGTGVGFSVQKHHVDKLPEILKPKGEQKFLVNDSIEG